MKWMNNIKIVAANFGDELGGDEGKGGGGFYWWAENSSLIGDESSWNRKAGFFFIFIFFFFLGCTAEWLQACCVIRLSKQMRAKGFNNAPKSC